ncbi:MAG TPA: SMI1/KNR4 family protein [Armatimonadota bacterium]|jgi:hypothetical protein
MNKHNLSMDALIDRFVATINRFPREPSIEGEIPPSVRHGEDLLGVFDWRITPWPTVDWIVPLEQRLGLALPPSYRSLVTRYVFPAFEVGPFQMSANTPEGTPFYEFRNRVFSDQAFVDILLPAGYIPLGNPFAGNYDQICFDTQRRKGAAGECPIVWIDHEEVLCNERIRVLEQVSSSFEAFAEGIVHAYGS